MGNAVMLTEVIIAVLRGCAETRDRIVQNRRKSRRLLENLEAIAKPFENNRKGGNIRRARRDFTEA